MQITDPIADLLTRIRNASTAKRPSVDVPASNLKKAICQILVDEGYIKGMKVTDDGKLVQAQRGGEGGGQRHGLRQRQQIVLPGGQKGLHPGRALPPVQRHMLADVIQIPGDEGTPPPAADDKYVHGFVSL